MSTLDLNRLEQYRDEILKAEIGVLLFNLGKTHIGFSFWRNYFPHKASEFKFSSYKEYAENYFYDELENISPQLKEFFENLEIDIGFFKTKFIELMKGIESNEEFVKRIFFRGCENINSGIDKGSPNKQLEPPLWLSNAFGSFKEEIKEANFDKEREKFVKNFYRCLKKQGYLNKNSNINWALIRNYVLKKIKKWYSHLLSDSRFPINDVSLYDQAYMTASMFKAILSQLVMDKDLEEIENHRYFQNPSSIKWRILGIQYDKLGLAEKGFKLASIEWYRERAKKIDKEIKELLEVKYPIGNEIYRDETGIYFIVGENLGQNNKEFAKLHNSLEEIEKEIIKIFEGDESEENLIDEIYPIIVLTKASRGLMNLGYLLENAKENFLKRKINNVKKFEFDEVEIEYVNNETSIRKIVQVKKGKNYIKNKKKEVIPNVAIGICPLCKIRLIYEEDKQKNNSPTICETCDNRIHHYQVKNWIINLGSETIWTSEIKDKNDRISLISLKFELKDWLNGNLLNSLLVREEDYNLFFNNIKQLLKQIKDTKWSNFNNFFINGQPYIERFLKLFDKNGIQVPFSSLLNNRNLKRILTQPENNLNKKEKFLKDLFYRSLENNFLSFFNKSLNDWLDKINNIENTNYNSQEKRFRRQQILDNQVIIEILKSSFSIGFVLIQIYNTLLERSIGDKWEEFIKNNLSNPNLIDFENRTIDWQNLINKDIEFLASLLLQFLLRKNPSPARLRRIWETTQEFFESIKKEILDNNTLEIPKWRRKRIIFEVDYTNSLKEKIKETGEELEGNGLLFWAQPDGNKLKIFLISSIEDFLNEYGTKEIKEKIKNREDFDITYDLIQENKENIIKDFTILLRKYSEKENKGEGSVILEINKDTIKDIHTYNPYASIIYPTPVGWQVIIPTEYTPKFIDLVMERYNKEFKYVYGKLPIHIGVVVQNYKKPLYIGINALRRIRRDVKDIDKLYIGNNFSEFCIKQKKKLALSTLEEKTNNTEDYYSLYWNNSNEKDYNFYIKPKNNWKKWISTLEKDKVEIVPTTFDFEFLDTNTRRNDIYYSEDNHYKRIFSLKSNRPYEIEKYWEKFRAFKELFKDKSNTAKMHKLVSLFYEKLQIYENRYNPLIASAIVNILELRKNKEAERCIQNIFDLDKNKDFLPELKDKLDEEKLKLFVDMFEFWHTALKEI